MSLLLFASSPIITIIPSRRGDGYIAIVGIWIMVTHIVMNGVVEDGDAKLARTLRDVRYLSLIAVAIKHIVVFGAIEYRNTEA